MKNFQYFSEYLTEFENEIFENSDNVVDENEKKSLFEQIAISDVKLKNRCCYFSLSDAMFYKNNHPTNNLLEFYLKVAKSGVALIFTAGMFIESNKVGKCLNMPFFDANNKEYQPYYRLLTDEIHTYGAKIFCTLEADFGRLNRNNKLFNVFNFSASLNRKYDDSRLYCARISDSKLSEIVEQFAEAAKHYLGCGFDGILIDGSMNNILGEMSSGEFNKRKFGYYSSKDEFPLKIVRKIIKTCGKIPLIYKFTISSFLTSVYKNDLDKISTLKNIGKERGIDEVLSFLSSLVKSGVDGFVFEFGIKETEFLHHEAELNLLKLTIEIYSAVKEYFFKSKLKNKFKEDVYLICGNQSGNKEKVVSAPFDLIDVSRNIYSNDNYLKNIKTQNLFKNCIKCCKCNDLCEKYAIFDCVVNPAIHNLRIFNHTSPKRVCVVGCGVSGIVSALTLAQRGCVVDVYDKSKTINKTGELLEVFGSDKELKSFNKYLKDEIKKHRRQGTVNLHLGKNITSESEEILNYEALIIATGFHEKLCSIHGAVLKNVKSIYDLLSAKNIHFNKNNIVIYAKSELSLKLAVYLSLQKARVTLVFQDVKTLLEIPNAKLTHYLFMIDRLKIKVFVDAIVKRINEDFCEIIINSNLKNKNISSVILNMKSCIHYGYQPQTVNIDLDLFVYEPELYSNNKLYYDLVKNGFEGELFLVGDALEVAGLLNNIKSAFFVGKNI